MRHETGLSSVLNMGYIVIEDNVVHNVIIIRTNTRYTTFEGLE